ncbi:hypothetical protein HELRODRAFT_74077, partial [Helobdella robusta]|uniref:Chitinase domain-containing protein 1 n=1 Tax=Helobdella robusta TaxID=6412 RepID=T1G1M1_HELRO
NVYQRGLVAKNVKASDILKDHSSYCDVEKEVKKFDGITLAYVTPWNNHGYDIAKIFSHKFTYVSPVWLQIVRKTTNNYEIKGKHDINSVWAAEVARSGSVAIVPRIIFDGWTSADMQTFFSTESEMGACIESIIDITVRKNFDGVVIELWSQNMGRYKDETIHFMGHLHQAMRELNKKIILVLPPPITRGNIKSGVLTQLDFSRLIKFVDAISLMTYDYSEPSRPGPNSPINWVEACVDFLEPNISSPIRKKILIGLNFYGYQFSNHATFHAVMGKQYLEILSAHKPKIHWENSTAEHYIKYRAKSNDYLLYYPTLLSIDMRIRLAKKLGVGISIWEIGQGLDYFYDLL